MVKLHRHFDTNDSIFLLLEYAAGGCLWNHVKIFRQHFSKSQDASGLPDENIGLSNDTSGVLQPTSGVLQSASGVLPPTSTVLPPTSGVLQPTSGVLQYASGVLQPTSGVLQSASGVLQPTSGVLQSASGVLRPTSGECEPPSDVLETTSIDETLPKTILDCDDGGNSGRDSTEIVVNKFRREDILNPLKGSRNSETNSLNSSNELYCSKDENSSFSNHRSTMKESKTETTDTSHAEQATCLTGQKTCLNQDKVKRSLEDEDNETGETCPTSCSDVLGFLDYVTKDYSAMDKCVQYWIAELLLAINSVHSCGIILK
jgi:hypothetical protein